MVGVRFSPYQTVSRDRKERKPVIEKMRRERMNNSISQLRDLISDTIRKHTAPMTRVDKADILEYAVIHLQELQNQHYHTLDSPAVTESQSYNNGFKDCARETVTFLTKNRLVGVNAINDVSDHLHTVYATRRTTGNQTQTTSFPCLSTPVRSFKMAHEPRLSDGLAHECSPIQRCVETTSPVDMPSFRIPEVDTSLCDLSFNTVLSVLHSTDSSSSDVSMKSKDSSSSENGASFGELTDSSSLCSMFESHKSNCKPQNVGYSGKWKKTKPPAVIWRPW